MNKFQKGDRVKVIGLGISHGKTATVDYFNGSKYAVDFDEQWHGYYYPDELEFFDDKKASLSQIEESLKRIEKKLDRILLTLALKI